MDLTIRDEQGDSLRVYPDEGGLSFWVRNLYACEECGDVSAGITLSRADAERLSAMIVAWLAEKG